VARSEHAVEKGKKQPMRRGWRMRRTGLSMKEIETALETRRSLRSLVRQIHPRTWS
jgi:hypothetical protein